MVFWCIHKILRIPRVLVDTMDAWFKDVSHVRHFMLTFVYSFN